MNGWMICEDVMPEVVAFPAKPKRYWLVRPEGKRGQFRGVLIHDEWAETIDRTYTQVGPLWLVLDALKDHRWRQGLPIVVRP